MTGIGPRERNEGDGTDDRAVSEVIAFVLVFAIIIGSVGILYMTGFQSMTDFQEGEQMRNAERAMSALGENLNDIQRNSGIQERSGELSLRGGTVSTTDGGTELNISVLEDNVTLGSVTYQQDSSLIAYEGGGVFRGVEGEPDQSVVLDRPRLTCNSKSGTAVISLIEISSDGNERSIGGDDTVEVTIVKNETRVKTLSESDPVDVEITVQDDSSAYKNGWATALNQSEWSWDSDTDTSTCEDVSAITVRIVEAEVEF
ncbi:hypothetical protein OB955_03420 [Halobacteria archaeon AArc-m2/3/4]|uniref:Flagellin n=1 Tax=Natronoglomus mannanivorans TaxID=2979990 RepID=A0ABT2QA60_9EURY|nr:hypothetical protein [Halobacteria archaeon AArc-m2/3/4]